MVETSAGEDKGLRRWRITVTVAAWLLITQSALAIISGLVGIALAPMADPSTMLGQLGPMVDRSSATLLDTVIRRTVFLNRIQTAGSVVLLVGSVGFLLRRKWGWYTVVVVHVAAAAAVFIWVMPILEAMYNVLDPGHAGVMALLLSLLGALAPAVVVAFLLMEPILSQFEKKGVQDSGIPGVQ